jgi:hypothetical protein
VLRNSTPHRHSLVLTMPLAQVAQSLITRAVVYIADAERCALQFEATHFAQYAVNTSPSPGTIFANLSCSETGEYQNW